MLKLLVLVPVILVDLAFGYWFLTLFVPQTIDLYYGTPVPFEWGHVFFMAYGFVFFLFRDVVADLTKLRKSFQREPKGRTNMKRIAYEVAYENATANPKLVTYKVGDQSLLQKVIEPKGTIKLPKGMAFRLIKTETVD